MSGGGGNRVPDAVSHWVQSGINLLGVVYYLMPIKTKQKCVYYKKKQFIYIYWGGLELTFKESSYKLKIIPFLSIVITPIF